MKKLCILRASPRKNGNTNALTDAAAARFREVGCTVREFDLYDLDIRPCTACRACQQDWATVTCAQQDDLAANLCIGDLEEGAGHLHCRRLHHLFHNRRPCQRHDGHGGRPCAAAAKLLFHAFFSPLIG